jgi:hypothetical protein
MAKKDYELYINSLLRENTEQSKQELLDLFANEEFRKNDMLEDTRLGYVYIAICIYRAEKAAHIEENILTNVESLGGIYDLICDIKFLLWRVEFQTESEALTQVVNRIEEEKLSVIAVEYIVRTACFDKKNVLLKLCECYIRLNKEEKAIEMLKYGKDING